MLGVVVHRPSLDGPRRSTQSGDLGTLRPPIPSRRRIGRAVALVACAWTAALAAEARAQDVLRLERVARAPLARLGGVGPLVDVAQDRAGRIFLLDQTLPGVVVTDTLLRRLAVTGRLGSGPGEFRDPVSLGVLGDGRVAVLDRVLRRVTILRLRDGGRSLHLDETLALRIPSESMCVVADGLLVYGPFDGARLHLLDLEGRRTRSFAPVDPKLSPMGREQLAKGRIACDVSRDEVIVATRFLPAVEAYRLSTGARMWADTLRPFRALEVVDRGKSVTISSGREGNSVVAGLFSLGDARVFQTTYESRRDGATVDTVLSYVYVRTAGRWSAVRSDAPLLFRVSEGMAISQPDVDALDIQLNRFVSTKAKADGPTKR